MLLLPLTLLLIKHIQEELIVIIAVGPYGLHLHKAARGQHLQDV